MPYQIRSDCPACRQIDVFLIGNWPEHLGVFACTACRALVNVPVADGKCPGCGRQPGPQEFLDYADSAPYLGRSFHKKLAAGPRCPKCGRDFVQFTNTRHLNMLAVVGNRAGAEAVKGQEYMEKALFRNSLAPVIAEFRLDAARVFAYFHLEPHRGRAATDRWSLPLVMDVRTHFAIHLAMDPAKYGSPLARDEVLDRMSGPPFLPPEPRKRWWQFWG